MYICFEKIKDIIKRDKLKKQLTEDNGIKMYYYSTIKNIISNEKIYTDKLELLNEIQDEKLL